MPQRKVSVINHYAFPPGSGGITRNFDMFSRLRGWQPHFLCCQHQPHLR
ncbi:glycosyltransferase [Cutibacterium acnes JCM 18916]|nr:glycosyltransferase [Cutibacterium acnes JCM 18916]GAE77062.1 glycosyltransferase [Cutibacterium acnes JCM 18918]